MRNRCSDLLIHTQIYMELQYIRDKESFHSIRPVDTHFQSSSCVISHYTKTISCEASVKGKWIN